MALNRLTGFGSIFYLGVIRRRTAVLLLLAAAMTSLASDENQGTAEDAHSPQAQPAQSQPASSPVATKPFQPGVRIDWQRRAVLVDARVVLNRGPLEFFACWPGKEHESILRVEAAPEHVYMALGLIGVSPGHPPLWDEQRQQYDLPAGGLVDVFVLWRADGREHQAGAFDWLREIEYARPPFPRPWVFAGSIQTDDGALVCGRTGVGFAVVDFPDSFLTLSTGYPSAADMLWVEATPDAIPPLNTSVTIELHPAAAREFDVVLDSRGDLYVNGRFTTARDMADVLRLSRRFSPNHAQRIIVAGALRADARRLQQALASAGLPADAFQFTEKESAP